MKKLNKILILIINLAICSTFFIKNTFTMTKSLPIDKISKRERNYSRPIDRELNSSPGVLQELLIASGYFFFEEGLKQILENLNKLEECTKELGFKKKKALENRKRDNSKRITNLTKKISTLTRNLDEYVDSYIFIANQQITNIEKNEIDRIVINSFESLPKVLDRLKTYIYTKDEKILEWIFNTIESQKNVIYSQ